MHGAQNVGLGADQSDIDRITRNALGRASHHRMSRQPLLMLVVSPGERQGDIGDDPVSDEKHHRGNDRRPQP